MTSHVAIRGPIDRADLPGLFARVCALLESAGPGDVLCDVENVTADAVVVDALARLQLAARRRGCRILLRGASRELRELVAIMGLAEVLTVSAEAGEAARTAGSGCRSPGRTPAAMARSENSA